jgi:hypothetical protein
MLGGSTGLFCPIRMSAAFRPLARYYREFVEAGGLMSYLPTLALS